VLAALAQFDAAGRAWVVGHRVAALDGPFWLLSAAGRGGLLFIAVAAARSWRRRDFRPLLRVVLAVLVASVAIDHVLKPIVGRERPFVRTPSVSVIGGTPGDSSFPSGHAGNAFAGASVLAREAPRAAALWWALAAAVALSRVYLGVHYPLDVIAGALIGLLAAAAAGPLAAALERAGRRV
jgi:undecaprenyl-diphosphatase